MTKKNSALLLIESEDQKGLVASITNILFAHNLNIISNHEFVEAERKRFFMRTEVEGQFQQTKLLDELHAKLPTNANIRIIEQQKKRILILVGKEAHCLGDLLIRCAYNELNAEIQAVISNHDHLRSLVEQFDLPFHRITHENKDRITHEQEIHNTIKPYRPDYLVLAKYMRILSPEFVSRYPQRIINIHHSFLPAFVGANPYRQAYNRGVKIIGATTHFVTESLDEGPIIAQSVNHVEHHHNPKDLAKSGKDIEKIVLARALSLVIEDRVFVSGNKTIIFD